jgi:hypothetical protein
LKNLQADPSVGVQVGSRRFTARARVASPAERGSFWLQMGFQLSHGMSPKINLEP